MCVEAADAHPQAEDELGGTPQVAAVHFFVASVAGGSAKAEAFITKAIGLFPVLGRLVLGWDGDGVTSPQSLVEHWFSVVDEQAVDWAGGDYPLDPDGEPVPSVYVTAEGQDLKQLVEKGMGLKAISKSMTRSEESIKTRVKIDKLKIAKKR